MNPSFAPQPPLADSIKSKIFSTYNQGIVSRPDVTDSQIVRGISTKFGVGMERVRAIIRLKELEVNWNKMVSLPTYFFPSFFSSSRCLSNH